MKKIKNITIIGQRWLDKPNANTYFCAVGLINGEEVVKIDFDFGGGGVYIQEITSKLIENKLLPEYKHYPNGAREEIWRYCQRNNIKLNTYYSDVQRRKDLGL